MFKGLLSYSLERIDSLHAFYQTQLKSIEEESTKGMDRTRTAFFLEQSLYRLMYASEEEEQQEEFLRVKLWMEKYIEITEVEKSKRVSFIPKDDSMFGKGEFSKMMKKLSKEYIRYAEMSVIHGSNTLIMLITRFEEFISNVLSEIFLACPNKYLNDKTISYIEVQELSLDKVQGIILQREIDAKMTAYHTEWFKLFKSHGMKFSFCQNELGHLVEIYARRNIVVHNNSSVNEAYKRRVPHTQAELGSKLNISKEYLEEAFATIRIIIFTVMIETSRMLKADDRDGYLSSIFLIAFEYLVEERYDICSNVFNQLANNKLLNDAERKLSEINCLIAQKELYGLPAVVDKISELEIDESDLSLKVAKQLLLENYDEVPKLIEEAYNHLFTSKEMEEWPIFKRYRETFLYQDFKLAHSEDFGALSVEIEPENESVPEIDSSSCCDTCETN